MIYVYHNKKEEAPILIWLSELKVKDKSTFNKVRHMLSLMQQHALPLVRPNVKKTPTQRTGVSNMYKIRLGHYRLFFLVEQQDYILMHAFRKSSNQTPEKEFRLLRKELKDYHYQPLIMDDNA